MQRESTDTVLIDTDLDALRDRAFQIAARSATTRPESVLYLSPDTGDARRLREQWAGHGAPIQFSIRTLDEVVDRAFDRSVAASPATYFDLSLHRVVVDAALHGLPGGHRFAPDDAPMTAGHLRQLRELLTLTEFGGLLDAGSIEERLAAIGVEALGDDLGDLKEAFERGRDSLPGDVDRTLRAERYAHVADTDPDAFFSAVDVIVLGAFDRFSPTERAVVEWLTSDTPTVAILPRFTDDGPAGIDRTLQHLWGTYTDDLDLVPQSVPDDDDADVWDDRNPPLDPDVFERFYRPTDEATFGVGDDLELIAPMDVEHEARYVTRRVQALLTEDDVAPDDVGVVLTDTGTYLDPVAAAAADRDLPVCFSRERDLDATRPGAAILDLLTYLEDPADERELAAFLKHPRVTLAGYDTEQTASEVAVAIEESLDHSDPTPLPAAVAEPVDAIAVDARRTHEGGIDAFGSFAAGFGLEEATFESGTDVDEEAWQTIESVVGTVAEGPTVEHRAPWIQSLRRALGSASVTTTHGSRADGVDVRGVLDGGERTYERVFVVGLTQSHYPSRGRRLAFTRELNEAHPDFEASKPDRRANHRIATLLSGATAATLTLPRTRADGSEYHDAGFLQELKRHTTLERTPVDEYAHLLDDDVPDESVGCTGDTWRALGVLAGRDREALRAGLDDGRTAISTYLDRAESIARGRGVEDGVAVAAARADAEAGRQNGWLSAETVTGLRSGDRNPISPSELETYAACGFKHYANYLLDLDADEEDRTAADRGTLVHDVLDEFYSSLQDAPHTPVDLANYDAVEIESRLLEVALDLIPEPDEDAAVTRGWRRELFAGLASADENPHYDPWNLDEPVRGTLASFVDEELVLRGASPDAGEAVTTVPAAFERYLTASVAGTELHGKVDRVDVAPDGEFVVRDYKTGRTPYADDVLDGLAFQLPVYLQLAAAETDHDPIGGTYYQVADPNAVSSYRTVLAAGDDAAWHANGGAPLRRHGHPRLDTRAEFETFLDDVVPERIGRIVESTEQGYFHPTVNDPADAGCRYCDYRDACDVRHGDRHAFLEGIDDSTADVYVPLAARDESYEPGRDEGDEPVGDSVASDGGTD